MIILEKGKYGIVSMNNIHNSNRRDKVLVHKNIDITGPVHTRENFLFLGYNEQIVCEDKKSTDILFELIANEL